MADVPQFPDAFHHAVGQVVVFWAGIEAQMEFLILAHQEIRPETGLLLTANLGYHSKMDLLKLFLKDIPRPADVGELKGLIERIGKAYPKRNGVAHAVWAPTKDDKVVMRMGIRTKGGKLATINELVPVDSIYDTADEIRIIGRDLDSFVRRYREVIEKRA